MSQVVLTWKRVTDQRAPLPGNYPNVNNSDPRHTNAHTQGASMEQPRDESSGQLLLLQDGPGKRVSPSNSPAGNRTTQMTPAAHTAAPQNLHLPPHAWIGSQGQCIAAASVPAPGLSNGAGPRHRIFVKIRGRTFTLDEALKKSASSAEEADVWLEAERKYLKMLIEQMADLDVSPNEHQVLLDLAEIIPNMIFPVSTLAIQSWILN